MILFSFFKIRPTRKSHYLKNINLHYFSRSCSFRREKQTEAFFQLSCSFPPANKVEERGLAVASIVSLFGISYTRWESIVHFWVLSEMEHFTMSAFYGALQGDMLQTLQQMKTNLATNWGKLNAIKLNNNSLTVTLVRQY